MSGGQNPNPLNGSLPPDWNRSPSMNTYQQNPCYNYNLHPFANADTNRRPANAFGYIPNQQTPYVNPQQQYVSPAINPQQQYVSPATHMCNHQMQYSQNSAFSPQHFVPQQLNYNDYMPITPLDQNQMPIYPSLVDRLALLESQYASNYTQLGADNYQTDPNNFGSALNGFVQDMLYTPQPIQTLPPLPSVPTQPLTTLYQASVLKQLNLDDFQYISEQIADDDSSKPKCTAMQLVRQWQVVRPSSHSDRSFHFSILNYNVLAQDLLESHPELYHRNEEGALEWPLRWRNLTEEFRKFNCDIICLQEVQESHKALFDVNFKSLGYSGLYKKRTGSKTDGCSIYYRDAMFNLLEFITVEYNQPRIDLLDRDNVAIIAKFVTIGNHQELVVANTHLLFNPRRQDIRLVQTQLLLAEIDRMAFKHVGPELCAYHPVIVMGDFNSTPDSSVIDFMKTGYLHYEHLNKRTLARENITSPTGKVLIPPVLKISDYCQHADMNVVRDFNLTREEQIIKLPLFHSEYKKQQAFVCAIPDVPKQFSTGTLRHNFRFQSVYNHGTVDNPEGTTNQGEWITTDYVFYNRSSGIRGKDWKLNLISRYTLPTLHELRNVAIPNYELGSDHLSLVAKFCLKTPRK